MKTLRAFQVRSILISVLYILMGVVLVIFPDTIAGLIAYIFAILILLLGIFLVALYVREEAFAISQKKNLTSGLILVVSAVYCLININFLINIIPTVMGLMVILNGLGKLQNAFDLFRTKNEGGSIILIFSLAVTAFGVILLINPFDAVKLFYILVGIALLIAGSTDIASIIIISKKLKHAVQDATAIDVTEKSRKI